MSEATGKRLNAVWKELNVGMQTLVDTLSKKGHKVDAKPTTKLTDEQYQILLNEFQADKKAKEAASSLSKDKPAKLKEITIESQKPKSVFKEDDDYEDVGMIIKSEQLSNKTAPKPVTKAAPAVDESNLVAPIIEPKIEEPIVVAPIEEVRVEPVIEVIATPEPKAEAPQVEESEEEEDGKLGLKVKGKIDLGALNTKTRPDKKTKKEKEAEKETSKTTKTKKTTKAVENEVEKVVDEKVIEAPVVIETPAAEVKTDIAEEASEIVDEPKLIEPNFQQLSGLKVMGKIALPVDAPKKPLPVASSDNANAGSKKKRKRNNFVGGSDNASKFKDFKGDKPATPASQRPIVTVANPSRPNSGGNRDNRFGKGRPTGKPEPKGEISDKEIQDKLKETLARLTPGSKNPNIGAVRSKLRKQKRTDARNEREEAEQEAELQSKILKVTEFVTANELAKMMDLQITQIISACMSLGMMVSINQRLDAETIAIVASEFGYEVEFVSAEVVETVEEDLDEPEDLLPRAPIVTVMGHVDHGKTSLLDYIRKANVIAGEAGGITQHVGAYEVTLENGKKIAFLDTPGHEAFTAMRARGAKITDIVIVVIAADDSVMPQTKEAISHALAAGVPIVFAINKIDRDGANPEKIKEQLAAMDILVEDWGGKYQCQEISAKKGLNIELLLEKVLLEAEILELKANPDKRAVGSVIEATLDKGRGIVATVMIQAGTLKVGDPIIAGVHSGRVRAMFDERGKKLQKAGPSTPCVILGFNGAPQAGDKLIATKNEQEAREISTKRQQLQREQGIRTHKHITLDEIGRRLAIGNFKELKVIVKGDVDGSVEALSDSLIKLSTEEVQVGVIFKGVGQISESDVMLASASDAIVIGFQVRPSPQARKLAEQEAIEIRTYSIIYDAIDQIKAAIEGMHTPKTEEKVTGNAEIREVFKVSKVGVVAGCMVTDGKLTRNAKVRLIRDGVVVYSGELSSLKRFKDDAKEVATGYDCGLQIGSYNDLQVGDYVEAYEDVEIKRK